MLDKGFIRFHLSVWKGTCASLRWIFVFSCGGGGGGGVGHTGQHIHLCMKQVTKFCLSRQLDCMQSTQIFDFLEVSPHTAPRTDGLTDRNSA